MDKRVKAEHKVEEAVGYHAKAFAVVHIVVYVGCQCGSVLYISVYRARLGPR
ncbi:MAG: hypothetical protein GX799_02275 [Crenarchaeota archaeon]|nr:hypothetical protein [Thermoproteota archaeon]